MNRRHFISSAIATAAFINHRAVAASDKVNLAVSGVRSRGKALATGFAALSDVNVVYVCEVDERVLGAAV
jgi:hypothetical protein